MNENLDTAEEMWVILWKAAEQGFIAELQETPPSLHTDTFPKEHFPDSFSTHVTDASSKGFNTDSRGLVTGLFGVGSRLKAAPAVPCPQTLGHL